MKKTFFLSFLALILVFCVPILKANAGVATLGYGGFNVYSAPCTCSGAGIWYVWYFPFLPYGPATGGALAVPLPPASIWYLNGDPLVPSTWALGNFVPGVQSCWQPGPDGCYLWPVLGEVTQVGSSLP